MENFFPGSILSELVATDPASLVAYVPLFAALLTAALACVLVHALDAGKVALARLSAVGVAVLVAAQVALAVTPAESPGHKGAVLAVCAVALAVEAYGLFWLARDTVRRLRASQGGQRLARRISRAADLTGPFGEMGHVYRGGKE